MTNTTLSDIATELAGVARDRNWSEVARLVEPSRDEVAVVRLLDADASGLVDWLRQQAPNVRVVLLDSDDPGWSFDRLLVAFPCGGLPTTDVIEQLTNGPLLRPHESLAVVMTGAEQITSIEDLALVESTARKWLLPRNADNVSVASAYLWSGADPSSEFSQRITSDGARLIAWLTTPLRPDTLASLLKARLGRALVLAAEWNERQRTASPAANATRINAAMEDLDTLRTRVMSRLRSNGDAQNAALRVAIDELQGGLLDGLEAYLGPYLHKHPEALTSESTIRSVMEQYLNETLDDWTRTSLPRLNIESSSATADLEQLINNVDWSAVNESSSVAYPEPILRHLHSDAWRSEPGSLSAENGPPLPRVAGVASTAGIVKSVGAGLLGCVAGALTGFGPAGMAVGGSLATAAIVGYQMHSANSESHDNVLQYARQTVHANMPAFRTKLLEHLDQTTDSQRRQIGVAFDNAMSALRNGYTASATATASDSRIVELRRRFDAVEPLT